MYFIITNYNESNFMSTASFKAKLPIERLKLAILRKHYWNGIHWSVH